MFQHFYDQLIPKLIVWCFRVSKSSCIEKFNLILIILIDLRCHFQCNRLSGLLGHKISYLIIMVKLVSQLVKKSRLTISDVTKNKNILMIAFLLFYKIFYLFHIFQLIESYIGFNVIFIKDMGLHLIKNLETEIQLINIFR